MSACSVPSFVQTWDRLRRPVWLYDPHTSRGVYANPPALALWGAQSLDELLARDFSVLSPAAKVRTDRLVALTADGGEVSERWTFYPNGQPVTVQASISAFSMDDGRQVLLFEASPTGVDAGERRAIEALRHTSAIITLFDREGGRLFANPAPMQPMDPTTLNSPRVLPIRPRVRRCLPPPSPARAWPGSMWSWRAMGLAGTTWTRGRCSIPSPGLRACC